MNQATDEKYMQRCLELASQAFGNTYPNPLVGSVIVHNGVVIGEGYHHRAGEPHAEVNAIRSVANPDLLAESTLYVNLEPCSHFGKTPPCADLIVEKRLKRVVVGCIDSFSKVSGKGIEKLKNAGIEVVTGVLQDESRHLNRRFFTFHEQQRPYIILKYAQTADKFIDRLSCDKPSPCGVKITNCECQQLVHQWRAQEQAILVGTNTAVNDNPSLTVRFAQGKNPIRIAWDLHNRIPQTAALCDNSTPTIIFTQSKSHTSSENLEFVYVENPQYLLQQTLQYLYIKGIQSLIVEGGSKTLQTFINAHLWDEARIFTTTETFGSGVKSPHIQGKITQTQTIGNAELKFVIP